VAKQILRVVLALICCLPLLRFVLLQLEPDPVVDYSSAAWKAREALIARAKVFVKSPPVIASLDLSRAPNDPKPFDPAALIECEYVAKPVKATTPKFDCRLPDGDIVKVKYGRSPERPGEVAASRLLAALGFGADHVTMLPKMRCTGCPPFPFQVRAIADWFFAAPLFDWLRNKDHVRDFQWVAVERKMAGRVIEVDPHEGWDWDELKLVDAAKGGATRAELDALRLIAMFLSHWDNKAANQRLACDEGAGGDDPQAPCTNPMLILQDVGATFGPTKVEHDEWAAIPIWADAPKCVVSLEKLPYRGGRFTPIQISEAGRALVAGKLTQLSEDQIRALFQSARFPDPASGAVNGDVSVWVKTFRDKVRQIAERPACPALPS